MFFHIDQTHYRDTAEIVRDALKDPVAIVRVKNRFIRSPEPIAHVIAAPRLADLAGVLGIDGVPVLVEVDPIARILVLTDQAFRITSGGVGAPPDHVLGQDVRRDGGI